MFDDFDTAIFWTGLAGLLLVILLVLGQRQKHRRVAARRAEHHAEDHSRSIKHLLENNRKWAEDMHKTDPDYFSRVASQQKPKYLWIGCADSRVPAHQVLGLPAGGVFVHRNVANLVVSTDMNMLSVLEYAVEKLEVEHILVTGHYGCGGIAASLQSQELGLIDNWLRNIRDVARMYQDELLSIEEHDDRVARLVELNVREQALNVLKTAIVQKKRLETKAKFGTAFPRVHGLVYSIADGILKELSVDHISDMRKHFKVYDLFSVEDASALFTPTVGPQDHMWDEDEELTPIEELLGPNAVARRRSVPGVTLDLPPVPESSRQRRRSTDSGVVSSVNNASTSPGSGPMGIRRPSQGVGMISSPELDVIQEEPVVSPLHPTQ